MSGAHNRGVPRGVGAGEQRRLSPAHFEVLHELRRTRSYEFLVPCLGTTVEKIRGLEAGSQYPAPTIARLEASIAAYVQRLRLAGVHVPGAERLVPAGAPPRQVRETLADLAAVGSECRRREPRHRPKPDAVETEPPSKSVPRGAR